MNEQNFDSRFTKTLRLMPVLAIGGESGAGDRLLQTIQPLCQDIRGMTIERCGHLIPEEQPEQLTQILLSFFKETARSK